MKITTKYFKIISVIFFFFVFLAFLFISNIQKANGNVEDLDINSITGLYNGVNVNGVIDEEHQQSDTSFNALNNKHTSNNQQLENLKNPIVEPGNYRIYSKVSYCRVVDIPCSSTNPETGIILFKDTGCMNQLFSFELDSNNYYVIKNVNSGLVLDLANSSLDLGAKIQQFPYTGNDNQKWEIKICDGGYLIKNKIGNAYLDLDNSFDNDCNSISSYSLHGEKNQIWGLAKEGETIKYSDFPIKDGGYMCSSSAASSKALDVNNASIQCDTDIIICEGHKGENQIFDLISDSNGYYHIKNLKSNLYLQSLNNCSANETIIVQQVKTDELSQKWVPVINSDGSFCFHNVIKSDMVLDLYGGIDVNCNRVQLFQYHGGNSQKWSLYNPNSKGTSNSKLLQPGYYCLAETSSLLNLDIPYSSRLENVNAQLFSKNNSINQTFYIDWVADGQTDLGWYKIHPCCTDGLFLSLNNGSVLPGSAVVTKQSEGEDILWSAVVVNGEIAFCNQASGLYMSLKSLSPANEVKIAGQQKNNVRTWAIQDPVFLNEGIYNISTAINQNFNIDMPESSRQEGERAIVWNNVHYLNQKWKVKKCANKNYSIQCLCSGLWLGVDSDNRVSQHSTQDNTNPDISLQWSVDVSKGYIRLKHVSTNKYLDLNEGRAEAGNYVQVFEKNDSLAQCWNFVATNLLSDGMYNIKPQYNLNVSLDVQNGSFSNGAAIQTFSSHGGNNQAFRITNNSDGTITFSNAKSRKCLDLSGGGAAKMNKIQQYDSNSSSFQKWIPVLTDDCYFYLKSAVDPNFVIDATECGNESPVVLYDYIPNHSKQKFTFCESRCEETHWAENCWYIDQNPELPWGCESVALTQLLTGMGYFYGKTHIADNYIPYSDWDYVNCYAGNPYVPYGIGCTMPPCICNAANSFLQNNGSSSRASVATGTSLGALIERAQCGYPSVVWTTMYMRSVVKHGDPLWGYQLYWGEHAVCLCGYDAASDSVLVCDSLAGKIWRNRAEFESIYDQIGRYCVVVD